MSTKILEIIEPGVLYGEDIQKLFKHAKENKFALPAVNVVGTNSINAVLEAAAIAKSAVIIQFSNGGASFYAGKGLKLDGFEAAIAGAISGAMHTHQMAELYGVPVILHTDHAAKKLLPWIDGLLEAGEDFYEQFGRPLYSSHMLEHLDRNGADKFLTEAYRVLRPNGIIRIAVPDIKKQITRYNDSGDADVFVESTHMCAARPISFSQKLRLLLVGTRHHQWMYDGNSLSRLLQKHGFIEAEVIPGGKTRIPKSGPLNLQERSSESVYVEANKPNV